MKTRFAVALALALALATAGAGSVQAAEVTGLWLTPVKGGQIRIERCGQEICGRVDPSSAKGPSESMQLHANMNHMHLIDPQTGLVL